jgi:hypothetical protein
MNRNLIAEVKKANRSAAASGTIAAPLGAQSSNFPKQPPTQPPSNQASIPPTVNIPGDLPPRRARRYYAVVKGRTLEIMDSWKSVLASVSGFSHAKYECFHSRPPAEEWYLQQLQVLGVIPEEHDLTEDEDSCCGRTVDLNSAGAPQGHDPVPPSVTDNRSTG